MQSQAKLEIEINNKESRQLVRIIMKYLRFGEMCYRQSKLDIRINVKCDSNMEYVYIKIKKDGLYFKDIQTQLPRGIMIRIHATSGKYVIKTTAADFKGRLARFTRMHFKKGCGRWGFSINLYEHWTKWHVDRLRYLEDSRKFPVKKGWRIHAVYDEVVDEDNYTRIKEFLKNLRGQCTIIFDTKNELEESFFDISDVALDEMMCWIRLDSERYSLEKGSSIAWYDHFLLSTNTRHEIESWWDTESNFVSAKDFVEVEDIEIK